MPDTSLAWHHTDEGNLASAARQPWTWVGAAARVVEADGEEITAAAALGYYRRQLVLSDVKGAAKRTRDRVDLQWTFRGIAQTPVWASGASPDVAFIDDGARMLGVSIGTKLRLVNPFTGDVVFDPELDWAFTREQNIHFIKLRSAGWLVMVDGVVVIDYPYDAAPESVSDPGIAGWGHLDAAGSSIARWQRVELGVNTDLPPQWKVDRYRYAMPSPIQRRWNGRWRALLRAAVGETHQLDNALNAVRELITAARRPTLTRTYTGKVDPTLEEPPWEYFGIPADVGIERERVRFAAGSIVVGYHELPPSLLAGQDPEAEWRAAGRFTMRSSVTTDVAGRAGPFLGIDNDDERIGAELFQDLVNPERWYWSLTTIKATGTPDKVTGREWDVDPFQAHHVELQVLGKTRVLLLVDGHIVDDAPYSLFTRGTAGPWIRVGRNSLAAVISCEVDIQDGLAEVRYADLRRRPLFLQRLVERLIFVGGCERNDRLDTWGRHHHEVQALRGTTRGIILEIARLSCDDAVEVVTDETPAAWYLERTFPEVSPIWLDAVGNLLDKTIEYRAGAPNFTPQELADLAVRYLLPRSTTELAYFMALASTLTAPTVDAGSTTFTVDDATGFDIGDDVTLRNAAATVFATGTILDIDQGTGDVETTLLGTSFIAGDIMRKVLATS